VQKARPLIGGYLGAAKSRRRDVQQTPAHVQRFVHRRSGPRRAYDLERLAAEVFGEAMSIDVSSTRPRQQPTAKASSPLRDDPVVRHSRSISARTSSSHEA
jgi:hypothetical protein